MEKKSVTKLKLLILKCETIKKSTNERVLSVLYFCKKTMKIKIKAIYAVKYIQ